VGQHDVAFTLRIGCRDAHQLEIERAVVVHDVEHVLAADDGMGGRVLDAFSTRPDRSRLGAQIGRVDEVLLGRDRGAHLDHQVLLAAREAGTHPVPLVRLVEQARVGCGIGADLVQPRCRAATRRRPSCRRRTGRRGERRPAEVFSMTSGGLPLTRSRTRSV
jgi:hypothetical protein